MGPPDPRTRRRENPLILLPCRPYRASPGRDCVDVSIEAAGNRSCAGATPIPRVEWRPQGQTRKDLPRGEVLLDSALDALEKSVLFVKGQAK